MSMRILQKFLYFGLKYNIMHLKSKILRVLLKYAYVNDFNKCLKNPRIRQEKILLNLLKVNQNTLFGAKHNFDKINSIEDYQENVPITNYKYYKNYIKKILDNKENVLSKERTIVFGRTSSTTGASKLIPITKSYIDVYRKSWQIWTYYLLKDHPDAFSEKILGISSRMIEDMKGKFPIGSISGLIYETQPSFIKKFFLLPLIVFSIRDYEARYYTILRLSIEKEISLLITANPSTILLLCKKAKEWRNEIIEDIEKGELSDKFKC